MQSIPGRSRTVDGDKRAVKEEAERMARELGHPVSVWKYCSTVSQGPGEAVWPVKKEEAEGGPGS